MNLKKPQFELTRVFSDGTNEIPEILQITGMPWETKTDRRGFLGTGIGASMLLMLINGHSATNELSFEEPAGKSGLGASTTNLDCGGSLAHSSTINTLAISPDGKVLASGSFDNTVKLWSLPEGALLKTLHADEFNVYTLAISPDGKILASGGLDETVKLWSLPEGVQLKKLEGHNYGVGALAISPDGKVLVSGCFDNKVKLWNLPEHGLLMSLEGHKNGVGALAISPDGKVLVSGGFDNTIKLWSLPEGALLKTLEGHKNRIDALAISPDGKVLVSGGFDNTIKLWSLPEGALLKTLLGDEFNVYALAVSPDGRMLASGSSDKTIKLWSLPEGTLLMTLSGHTNSVNALAISPDGRVLVSGSSDKTIKLWSLPEGAFKTCLIDLKSSPNTVKGVTYTTQSTTGQTVTYTLPCGSPIPPGATCTCNCVPGSISTPTYRPGTPTYNQSGGTYCSCNKVCTCVPVYSSDVNSKTNFALVDTKQVLDKLAALPIRTWNYREDGESARHIGPMAQDFSAIFGVGADDLHISAVDANGVAFAAIQALHQQIGKRDAEISTQNKRIAELEAKLEAIAQSLR